MDRRKKYILFGTVLTFMLAMTVGGNKEEPSREEKVPTSAVETIPTIAPTETPIPTETPAQPTETPAIPTEVPVNYGEEETIRIVLDGKAYEATARLGDDGDWYVSPSVLGQALGVTDSGGEPYVSLRKTAKSANWGYVHDDVLRAAYLRTDEVYGLTGDYNDGLELAYMPASVASLEREKPMRSTELREALAAFVAHYAPEKLDWFEAKVTAYDVSLTRGEASLMAWYAAVATGADDYNYYDNGRSNGDDFWDCDSQRMEKLFPDCWSIPVTAKSGDKWNNEFTAGYLWNVWHISPKSGLQIIAYDFEAESIRTCDLLTVEDGISAVARLDHYFDTVDLTPNFVTLDDPLALKPNTAYLSDELLAKAAETPIKKMDELPTLNGFVLSEGGDYNSRRIVTTPQDLEWIANWGFSGSRLMLTYQTFFTEDCTAVDEARLSQLDELVAEAIRLDLHLNILLQSLPGRWVGFNGETFESVADTDLFVEGNTEDRKKTVAIWEVLAERYKDVPGAYLSFTPFWEPTNGNLSTGLAWLEYDEKDILEVLRLLVDAIREKDADRFIIYESCNDNLLEAAVSSSVMTYQTMDAEYENIMISYNFCEQPYVYAEMTDVEGKHIDFANRGMFKPEYPVTFYALNGSVADEQPLVFDGFLPEGTRLDIHVKQAGPGSKMIVLCDDEVLTTETLTEATYEIGNNLSRYYQFATSEKVISVTLPQTAKEVKITVEGGWFNWSGIEVNLPEQYAKERWYFPSWYDSVMFGETATTPEIRTTTQILILANEWEADVRRATIKEDLSYTTEMVLEQANRETVETWVNGVTKFSPEAVVRFEAACFSNGTTLSSALRYYGDMLNAFSEVEFGWLSNDYLFVWGGMPAESENVPYDGREKFEAKLIQLFQKYQSDVIVLEE